ncbi:GmrSD restriction endonuclease domain-containing protein [Myxococcus xanthus]|uniref:DUF262 domain-containing protein n=1 Tax=Myxococcus xanthus TaxID=34 RepID=A0A7Y4II14_MYXXA|nr:DUF262 domain-containing protein [Myxococcus xanthus]NOJ79205.1 DUF262 domain-containing protein [Myxococcus xanthus]NOJ86579.1 DUF262 domain-containing protein [Myxococcus xanthus]
MSDVSVAIRPVKTCFQSRYTLPTFQRDYKWESKHFTELLSDIQGTFLESYESTHGRKDVASYRSYFLGSIITSAEKGGQKPIVDGQQRLTSIFVLMAYLKRYCHDQEIAHVEDLSTLLQRTSYGTIDYTIEFSESRRSIFREYLNYDQSVSTAMEKIDSLSGLDSGDLRVVEVLKSVDKEIHETVKQHIQFFIDYLVEKVELIEISVASENDAHRVFVTMNDRGLRLGPIDLLKGHILSKVTDAEVNQKCHELWVKTVNDLRRLGAEEDSLFFRAMFRARWSNTIRGKKKGDPPGDFDHIGDSYHRWFVDNATNIGIVTSDDYSRFSRDEITKYADIYAAIRRAEEEFDPAYEHVFYNSVHKYTLQAMVLLAPIKPNDTDTEWQSKVQLVARFLDLILTSRSIEGKDNNYDNLRDISYGITRAIRGMDHSAVLTYVQTEWDTHLQAMQGIGNLSYAKSERSDILYILARIADFLENKIQLTNSVGFGVYVQRDRGGRTFDIEHLLCAPSQNATQMGFASPAEYTELRNRLGALVLLPRSRNRSLQDKSYIDKLAAYSTENVLAQSLCSGFYQNNPNVNGFTTTHPTMKLRAIPSFSKAEIDERAEVYRAVALEIWKKP